MSKHTKKLTHQSSSIKSLKSIIYKSTKQLNQKDILEQIFSFLKTNVHQPKFDSLYKKTTFFGSDKLGKSGALVGVVKIKGKEYVIKMYKLNEKEKYIYAYENKCIKLYYPFNELIINSVFSNMKTFLSHQNYKTYKSKYSQFLIPTKDIGLTNTHSYMINEKIGVTNNNVFYTNLYDILTINFIPNLLKCIKNNDTKKIDMCLINFTTMLEEYFECIQFLNENLGYINSDLKCKNVFIKKNNKKSLDTFITNFTPLISDLDKATIEINGVLILPRSDKKIEKYLTKRTHKLSKVYEIRYNCSRNTLLCNRFKPHLYDIITLFFDIYIILYKKIYKKLKLPVKDYYDYFKILNNLVKKTLNINDEEFTKFYKRIHSSYLLKVKSGIKLSIHINAMLYNFCKSL